MAYQSVNRSAGKLLQTLAELLDAQLESELSPGWVSGWQATSSADRGGIG